MRRLEITRKDPRRDAKKRGGDTIYYGGDVWEAFTKKDDKDALDNEIAVYVSHAPAGGEAPSQPTH